MQSQNDQPPGANDVTLVAQRSQQGSARLILRRADGQLKEYGLDKDEISIGRLASNDVSLPDDRSVSRRHAVIRRSNVGYVIEDQQSNNGTYVDGEKILYPFVLHNGQSIKIGANELTFTMSSAHLKAAAQPEIQPFPVAASGQASGQIPTQADYAAFPSPPETPPPAEPPAPAFPPPAPAFPPLPQPTPAFQQPAPAFPSESTPAFQQPAPAFSPQPVPAFPPQFAPPAPEPAPAFPPPVPAFQQPAPAFPPQFAPPAPEPASFPAPPPVAGPAFSSQPAPNYQAQFPQGQGQSGWIRCPSCNELTQPNKNFCLSCGATLGAQSAPAAPAAMPGPSAFGAQPPGFFPTNPGGPAAGPAFGQPPVNNPQAWPPPQPAPQPWPQQAPPQPAQQPWPQAQPGQFGAPAPAPAAGPIDAVVLFSRIMRLMQPGEIRVRLTTQFVGPGILQPGMMIMVRVWSAPQDAFFLSSPWIHLRVPGPGGVEEGVMQATPRPMAPGAPYQLFFLISDASGQPLQQNPGQADITITDQPVSSFEGQSTLRLPI